MKKKGFTLVELLAVIVILAIIALIATPLILNVIENSKKGAFKTSVIGIMESAELYKVLNPNDSTADSDIIFRCNGTSCKNGDKELSIKGSIPVAGTVTISKDGISVTDITDLKYIANGTKEELTIIKASDRNDTTPPVINKEKITIKTTSSSITILVNEDAAVDKETGIVKYTVNIYDSNDNKTTKTRNNIGSIEFKGLTSGEYKIEVIATNGNNLETKEILDNITTDVIDEPTYSVSPTGWAQSKEITITYPSGYTNEYSLDGTTWLEYKNPITLTENGTIIARVTDGINYVEGSSFTVDQIDNVVPSINLNNLPSTLTKGDSLYNKKIIEYVEYSINDAPSGLKEVSCTEQDKLLNSLEAKTYTITCKIVTNSGKEASISKNVEITNQAYQATNLISNGSFENDLNGWFNGLYSSDSLIKKYGSYSFKINIQNNQAFVRKLYDDIDIPYNHLIYTKVSTYKDDISLVPGMYLYLTSKTDSHFPESQYPNYTIGLTIWENSSIINYWNSISIYTNAEFNHVLIQLAQANGTATGNVYFDGLLIVDLTETFGAGNEPDKEWCDRNIDYFDGTTTIYK